MIGLIFPYNDVGEGEGEAVGHDAVGGEPAAELTVASVVAGDVAIGATGAGGDPLLLLAEHFGLWHLSDLVA